MKRKKAPSRWLTHQTPLRRSAIAKLGGIKRFDNNSERMVEMGRKGGLACAAKEGRMKELSALGLAARRRKRDERLALEEEARRKERKKNESSTE